MRIGIDIRSLQNDSKLRGIGTYTHCLVENILRLDKKNEYVFFVFKNRPLPDLSEDIFSKVTIKKISSQRKRFVWLWGQVAFPCAIAKEKLDLFHSPEYIIPAFSFSKRIITVHDFIHSDYKYYKRKNTLLRNGYLYLRNKTIRCADKIIAVSEYTKKKIVELIGIKEGKIRVIYEASSGVFRPINDHSLFLKLKNKYGIDKDFILYAGTFDHHKNLDTLIKSFARVRAGDTGLVLAGDITNKYNYKMINELIVQLGLAQRVYILGHVVPEELAGLYNMAKIVISVSVYEGFGLPILEAMSCARPVIAAKNTSMREIVGLSGVLVNPYDIDEIAGAMERLLFDEQLRISLGDKGFARSKEFSWEKAAWETLAVYEEVIGWK